MSRYLIVGLGNPGAKYEKTRHNIGFMMVERFAARHRVSLTQTKFHARYGTGVACQVDVVLLEPQTFMNLSGKSVAPAAKFYNLEPTHIIVAHDELDLAAGTLRVKQGGGHGGHNGLRDIIAQTGKPDFLRLRLGIGRPEHGDVTSHVLGAFRPDEHPLIDDLIERGCNALECILVDGVTIAQNRYN